jgi:hypothetical protein
MTMRSVVCLAAFVLLTPGCGGSLLDESKVLFNAGRYSDAKAKLERVAATDYHGFDVRARATYALYRGLVFGALGDRGNAIAWLGLAKETVESHVGALNRDDAVRLKLAEQQYGPLPLTSESNSAP